MIKINLKNLKDLEELYINAPISLNALQYMVSDVLAANTITPKIAGFIENLKDLGIIKKTDEPEQLNS